MRYPFGKWGALGTVLDKLQQFKKKNPGETEQKNWYTDRYQSVIVQRNLLFIFSVAALVFSTIAIFMVYRNIPIVTVEPFVIQIEPKSGLTQVVNPLTSQEITASESINQYFIVRYVKARESVDGALPYHFETVRLMSDPNLVFNTYAWEVNPNNPESFLARFRNDGVRGVKIRYIQKLDLNPDCIEKVCAVNIGVTITEGARGSAPVEKRILIYMEYLFTNVELSIEERYINPIGFRVTAYRLTTENVK